MIASPFVLRASCFVLDGHVRDVSSQAGFVVLVRRVDCDMWCDNYSSQAVNVKMLGLEGSGEEVWMF